MKIIKNVKYPDRTIPKNYLKFFNVNMFQYGSVISHPLNRMLVVVLIKQIAGVVYVVKTNVLVTTCVGMLMTTKRGTLMSCVRLWPSRVCPHGLRHEARSHDRWNGPRPRWKLLEHNVLSRMLELRYVLYLYYVVFFYRFLL